MRREIPGAFLWHIYLSGAYTFEDVTQGKDRTRRGIPMPWKDPRMRRRDTCDTPGHHGTAGALRSGFFIGNAGAFRTGVNIIHFG